MGETPRRSPLPAIAVLLAATLCAPLGAGLHSRGGADPGLSVWIPTSGFSRDTRVRCRVVQSRSCRLPPRLTAQASCCPIRARLGRDLRPIRNGWNGAGSPRAQSKLRLPSRSRGCQERGYSSAADGEPRTSPARSAAATFQPTLGKQRAASQVTSPAPHRGRASVPWERGPAGGAGGGRAGR